MSLFISSLARIHHILKLRDLQHISVLFEVINVFIFNSEQSPLSSSQGLDDGHNSRIHLTNFKVGAAIPGLANWKNPHQAHDCVCYRSEIIKLDRVQKFFS